jgi:ABC-type transport system involved in multi-copper enzyme maturation permease subunit
MQKFFSILRDSFREAVDGWIIYVMLAANALLILGVASVSFQPADADTAFRVIIRQFNQVFPDRGHSAAQQRFGCIFFIPEVRKTNDAKSPQEGDYRFVLNAVDNSVVLDEIKKMQLKERALKAEKEEPDKKDEKKEKKKPDDKDASKPDKKDEEQKPKRDPADSEFRQAVAYWTMVPDLRNPQFPDAGKVTDEEMVAFIKDQFSTYANMEIAKVTKLPQTEEGVYSFEIETKGMKGAKGWVHDVRIGFGAVKLPWPRTLGRLVYYIEDTLVNTLGAIVALLISVVITSFFIPNMMRKGAIDLLLSKPIMRPTLLVYKYIGGLIFVFLNTTIAVGGVWLVLGLRSGIWSNRFLLVIFGITFFFAILYAVSTLIAVLTRNAIVAILITVGFWFVMYLVGVIYVGADAFRKQKEAKDIVQEYKWAFTTADVLHAVIPRTKDLDNLTTRLIIDDTLSVAEKREFQVDLITFPPWGEVIGVSGAWIAILLGLSCWRFSTRDY